jgi:hypothetical protein
MTVYELDPNYCRLHIDSNEVVVHWPALRPGQQPLFHRGQRITVEIAGRIHAATVTAVRRRYAVACLGGAA